MTNINIQSLAASGNIVYAGTHGGGLFRSLDSGASWTHVSGLPFIHLYDLEIVGTKVYAACNGIYMSADSGATWTQTGIGSMLVLSMAVKGSSLFAGTLNNALYRSDDGGNSWTQKSTGFPSIACDVNHIIVDDTVLYAALCFDYDGVFRSIDNGESWQSAGLGNQCDHSLAVSGQAIIAGSYEMGLFRTTDDGATWSRANHGIMCADVSDLAENGNFIFAGTPYLGSYVTPDQGSTWNETGSNIPALFEIKAMASMNNNLYAGTPSGIYITSDNGASWNLCPGSVQLNVGSMTTDGTNLYAGANGLYRSTDQGLSWDSLNFPNVPVISLKVQGNLILAGTMENFLFVSQDGGTSWTQLDDSNGLLHSDFTAVEIIDSVWLAGACNGIYRSTDEGNSWDYVFQTTPVWPYVSDFLVNGSLVYAAMLDSIYVSADAGLSWMNVSDGLDGAGVYKLLLHGSDMYAGTTHSVWKRPLNELNGITEASSNASLSMFPNPASSVLTVHTSGAEKISIYDLQGRFMKSVKANQDQTQVPVSDLAPGVYLVKVISDTGISCGRFMKE